jgi:hypothetical protein
MDHFTDVWNVLDLAVIILQAVYLCEGEHHPHLFAWLTLVSYIVGLKFFRAFHSTRVFI